MEKAHGNAFYAKLASILRADADRRFGRSKGSSSLKKKSPLQIVEQFSRDSSLLGPKFKSVQSKTQSHMSKTLNARHFQAAAP